jgi:hypothetical protein
MAGDMRRFSDVDSADEPGGLAGVEQAPSMTGNRADVRVR